MEKFILDLSSDSDNFFDANEVDFEKKSSDRITTFNSENNGAFEQEVNKHTVDHTKLIRRASLFQSAILTNHANEVIA
jgi:hypothetical protein